MTFSPTTKGMTMIEILISVAVLAALATIIVPSLSRFRNQQVLGNTADDIVSLLNEARAQTLSSQDSTYYSVHFESARAVLFTGGTFTDGVATNKVITFDNLVSLPSSGGINLNGGGSNVTFTRLSGDTSQYGSLVVRLKSDATRQKTITITSTGIISVN